MHESHACESTILISHIPGRSQLKGCVQQARKWLFRPKFFSLSKWAQFLHVTLDLTGKRCPVIFSAVLFFVFEKFSSTSTGGKCALRWFYCLEKQKLSLERTPPVQKLRFCIRYLWKMKEKPADLNGGLCFSIKWKATCRNWAHLDEEKNFGLKSHWRACCTQPFKNITPLGMNCLARATVTYTRSALAPNKSSMSEWSIAVEAYLRRWFRWPFFRPPGS